MATSSFNFRLLGIQILAARGVIRNDATQACHNFSVSCKTPELHRGKVGTWAGNTADRKRIIIEGGCERGLGELKIAGAKHARRALSRNLAGNTLFAHPGN